MRYLKPVVFYLALLLVGLIPLLMLEGGARLLNRLEFLPPATMWEYRLRQPEPYADAPYFSRDFVRESQRHPGGWSTPQGGRLVLPHDFSGTWFTTRDGLRHTVGQPERAVHTVYLFGGSTLFNAEVPDAHTVASQLQSLLNQRHPSMWRVENYGASSVNAAQQLERLRSIPLRAGDMVVFYDGVNDAVQGVFYQNPEGWMVQSNRDKLAHLGSVQAFTLRLQLWLRDHSALGAAILPAPDATAPAHLANDAELAALVNHTADLYRKALREAALYTEQRGARFIHVLQPNLFTKASWTPYETSLAANSMLVADGLQRTINATYPALREASANLQADGMVTTLDMTDALDSVNNTYLDFCHVAHAGNAEIAARLAAVVK